MTSAAPAWLVAQPGGEPLIVRAEMLLQGGPDRAGHRGPGPGILRGEGRGAQVGQAEEVENLVVHRPWRVEELAAVDHVDPVTAEDAL
jgi:hypothetical protein